MNAPANILTAGTITGLIIGPSPVQIAVAVTASLFPDIDTPKSTMGRIPVIPTLINTIFQHRTITHSILFYSLSCLMINNFCPQLTLAWAIGYSVHILLDILTPQGVMLFWPYPIWISLKILSTGGILETVYTLALLVFNLTWGKLFWIKTSKNLILGIRDFLSNFHLPLF